MFKLERLKVWEEEDLRHVEKGLDRLDQDPVQNRLRKTAERYGSLHASRFENKYLGDQLAALRWAILEKNGKLSGSWFSALRFSWTIIG